MLAQTDNITQGATCIGMHERHLQRREGNPLYAIPPIEYSTEAVLQARQRDSEELHEFHNEMRSVIQQAIELESHVESEIILELRGKLDQLYARCSSFGINCGEHKQNIRKLVDLVMKAVWQAAGDDPQARRELEQEEMARQQHYRLLEYPLIADMLRPDSPIAHNELVATLLCAAPDEVETLSWVFDPEQLSQLCNDAERLLRQRKEQGYPLPEAWAQLQLMQEQSHA